MIDVLVPEEQEGTKAVVRAWLKQVGDRVEENDPLVELETDKVAMEVPAPAAGVLREILLHSNADAVPGAVLGRIAPAAEVGDVECAAGRPARRQAARAASGRPRQARCRARDAAVALGQARRAPARHRSRPDRRHRPRRPDHPRRRRPRGRAGDAGAAAGRRRDSGCAIDAAGAPPGRHPLALRAARPDAAPDRREHARLGHPGAARHRRVRGGFQRDHRPSRRAQGGLTRRRASSSPTPPISSPPRPRR